MTYFKYSAFHFIYTQDTILGYYNLVYVFKKTVFTSSSSSPGWKAPVVLWPMSAAFLRPPSPLRLPPEPLEDMELEELGSLGLLTVGNCGRL